MFANKKAHYNLLRLRSPDEEAWETRDYRTLSVGEILTELQKLEAPFQSVEQFEQTANDYDSPEDLAETFLGGAKEPDRGYLLLFELWRRHLPEKRAVSIFCDELDQLITHYYEGRGSEETVDIIEYLKQILDDNADTGVPPKDVLPTLQHASCHDIEAFLYDFALDQIEGEELEYAEELIEGFYPYLIYPEWFDYLIARIEILNNKTKGHKLLTQVVEKVEDVDFALEILDYLASTHNPLFPKLAYKALDFLETESDLLDLLDISSCYFGEILPKPKKKSSHRPIEPSSAEIKKLREFFSAKS